MASRPKSIPPPWRELSPFRCVFTRHLPDEETREAFQRLGAFLFAAALETSTTTPPEPSEVAADLQAVAQDLAWIAQFLRRVVAGSVEAFELSTEDVELATMAGAWSVRADLLASDISEALP